MSSAAALQGTVQQFPETRLKSEASDEVVATLLVPYLGELWGGRHPGG